MEGSPSVLRSTLSPSFAFLLQMRQQNMAVQAVRLLVSSQNPAVTDSMAIYMNSFETMPWMRETSSRSQPSLCIKTSSARRSAARCADQLFQRRARAGQSNSGGDAESRRAQRPEVISARESFSVALFVHSV